MKIQRPDCQKIAAMALKIWILKENNNRQTRKFRLFIEGWYVILIKNIYKFLLLLLAPLKYPSIRVTHTHLTLSLWIEKNKSISKWEQKTSTTKSEKWRHARTSAEIAWTNEQKADLKWLWRHMVATKILTTK